MKYQDKFVIWLLKNLKTVYKEIDSQRNKCMNHFNDLKHFVNIIQGTFEGDDEYIKRVRLSIEHLIFSGGCHVL